ncbi:hypothetical protein K0C01_02755 [Salinarchaeum sp. IM2453]|uniref:hypothetical protein n=1 Tax=Salinarchaeum sp. IM2453 TaxID=2862870 RepID=UPI001C8281B1|nr:hypothetical protein [Salinarchaeum sp. IM2453]QZA89092.1 hypothetical protein K0C01_02755 [Salinarchaeum sp. IM2453]
MQHFKRVYVNSCPDVYLFVFNLQFGLIDRDRLSPVAVRLKEMFEPMILVVDGDVTYVYERFDPPERQPGVIQKTSEDTLLGRRVLAGKYFLLARLL